MRGFLGKSRQTIVVVIVFALVTTMVSLPAVASPVLQEQYPTDSVKPVMWTRNFTETEMMVHVWLNNSLTVNVTAEARLSLPEWFEEGLKSENSIEFVEGGDFRSWGLILPGTVQYSPKPFFLSVASPFYEPPYFILEVRWQVSEDPRLGWFSHEYNLTRIEEGDRGGDFGVSSVQVLTPNVDKGDPIEFRVTIVNWGPSTGSIYLNLEIKENSNLYIGFDLGVWAFPGHGHNTGVGVRAPRPWEEVVYRSIDISVGPFLEDDERGLWALNGRIKDTPNYHSEAVSYEAAEVTCWTSLRGQGGSKSGHWDFTVQDTGDHDVFMATIKDNWWGYWMEEINESPDETLFVQNSFNHPMVVRQGGNDVDVGSFAEYFDFTFHTKHVGILNWDDAALHATTLKTEALHRTADVLGQGIGMAGSWVSAKVNDRDPSILPAGQAFTMRENHGFDVGLGILGVHYLLWGWIVTARIEGGLAWDVDGTVGMTLNTPQSSGTHYLDWQMECVVHEFCHLVGCIHVDPGYACIMGAGTGDDTGNGQFRMSPQTSSTIWQSKNLLQFSGAAVPYTYYGPKHGQWICHVSFTFTAPNSPAQYIDNYPGQGGPGMYWGYSTWYQRFWVTSIRGGLHVDANIDYSSYGKSYFFAGYWLRWTEEHWPSGFSPFVTPLGLFFDCEVKECASISSHYVTNFRVWIADSDEIDPYFHKQWTFYGDTDDFHWEWAWIDDQTGTEDMFYDANVFLLFGFRDAWSADWGQDVYVKPWLMQLYYELG
ncbi:MAG: hypothetical protein RTU09_09410 [Candidatus Thorarchaeota archaeon]